MTEEIREIENQMMRDYDREKSRFWSLSAEQCELYAIELNRRGHYKSAEVFREAAREARRKGK